MTKVNASIKPAFLAALTVVICFLLANHTASADPVMVVNVTESAAEGSQTADSLSWWLSVLAGPVLALVGVGLVAYYTRRNVITEQWVKANQAESVYLQSKLDKFYGPFTIISNANHLMAQDLRSRQPAPEAYRLLDKLFDADWRDNLSSGDKVFVAEICRMGKRLGTIIEENLGWIDVELQPFLSRALAHFTVLHLAYKQKLGTDSKPYLKYVYPNKLDEVLAEEVGRIRERLELLKREPTKQHPHLGPMNLERYTLHQWPDPARPEFDPDADKLLVNCPNTGGGEAIERDGS